jgi:hypothetical protein
VPITHAVDAGVEEIQAEMDAAQVIAADDLLGDGPDRGGGAGEVNKRA